MIGGLGKINRYLLAGAGVMAILAGAGSAAKAASAEQLEATLKAMQAQMQELQRQVQEAKAAAASAQAAASSGSGSDLDLKVKWKGAPEFSSGDGKFKMKIRGRLETDYNNIDQDTRITSFPDVSATELRRARLGVEGILFYDWKYVIEVDFANDSVVMKDAYLQHQGYKIGEKPLLFRVGNFKTPNTFEDETSDRFVDTMERASFINAWDIERQIGFMTAYYAPHLNLSAGIFGQRFQSTLDAPLFPGFTGDEDVTFAARAGWAPINRETPHGEQVLHIGASVRTRDRGNDQLYFQYGARAKGADLNRANAPVQTGRIGEDDTFWGLEAATLWGPFSLQGEYGHIDVGLPGGSRIQSNPPTISINQSPNPFVGVPDPSYDGWYVEGSWFFGGHKTYEDEGTWGRPVINNPMFHGKGGWGAWQIVGKYDVLNMSDNAFNDAGGCRNTRLYPGLSTVPAGAELANNIPLCGDMKTWVVGVNWWMTPYMRLMFNYAQSDLSGYPIFVPQDADLPPGKDNGFDGATIRGFGMRAQVDW
jgi:phosphate-selective porin OprO and OprP